MATYTKETRTNADGNGEAVRYKEGNKYVAADQVPQNVKDALAERADGQVVDELGDDFNPETDTDESADESAPTKSEDDGTPDDDETADDDDDETTKAPETAKATRRTRRTSKTDDGSGEEGMGFPRVNGKTVDIFDGKTPHTHVKPVNGLMVPLSKESFENRTDVEIADKLRELGKI